MAAQLKADVTLLCVVERKKRHPESSLQRAAAALEKTGAVFESLEREGKLVEQMLAVLLQRDFDLVVVGYHSRSFFDKAIWGSLATRIAHELPVSVLIVRGRRDWISRVLIGISGGGFTDECVAWGGRIAAAFDAHVILLHVSPPPPLMYAGLEEVVEDLTEFLQTDTLGAQAFRQSVARLTDLGVTSDVELARGLPERELLRLAQDQDVDLVVIGSSWAAQPMTRALVRNITEQVLLNTQRPVLVVRPVE